MSNTMEDIRERTKLKAWKRSSVNNSSEEQLALEPRMGLESFGGALLKSLII